MNSRDGAELYRTALGGDAATAKATPKRAILLATWQIRRLAMAAHAIDRLSDRVVPALARVPAT